MRKRTRVYSLKKTVFLALLCLMLIMPIVSAKCKSDENCSFFLRDTKTLNNWSEDIRLTCTNQSQDPNVKNKTSSPTIFVCDNTLHLVYRNESLNYTEIGTGVRAWILRLGDICYLRSDDYGRTWQGPLKLTNDEYDIDPVGCCNASSYPDIAYWNNNVYVVWQKVTSTDNFEIYFKNSSDNGNTWQSDTVLTSNDGKMSKEPCVGVNENNIHVVWVDERSGDDYYELFYQRSTDGGVTWDDGLGNIGNVTQLTTCVPPLADYLPNMAVYGDFIHVTWTHYAGEILVKYMKSDDNGAHWTEPTTLSTTGDAHSETSNIAVSGSMVHVVWEEEKDGNTEIYYRNSSNNGESFNPEVRLTETSAEEYDPHITVNGSWVWVSWWNDGDHCGYYRLSKDNGITWEDPVKLTNQSGTPMLAVSDGYVHAMFTSDRTGNSEIYYKRYPKFNDPPSIDYYYPETNVTITETQTQLFSVNAMDPDNDTLTYQWYLNDSLLVNETNLSYTFIPNGSMSGNYTVKVVISDGEHEVNQTWVVTVINVQQLQETINNLQTQLYQLNESYTKLLTTLTQLSDELTSIWLQLNNSELNNTELQIKLQGLNENLTALKNQLALSNQNTTILQDLISDLNQGLNISNEQVTALWSILNQSLANETELWNLITQLNQSINSLQGELDKLREENEQVVREREATEERLMIAVILVIGAILICILLGVTKKKK